MFQADKFYNSKIVKASLFAFLLARVSKLSVNKLNRAPDVTIIDDKTKKGVILEYDCFGKVTITIAYDSFRTTSMKFEFQDDSSKNFIKNYTPIHFNDVLYEDDLERFFNITMDRFFKMFGATYNNFEISSLTVTAHN